MLNEEEQSALQPERPTQEAAYEHLFPGQQFDHLPNFNPLNTLRLLSYIMVDSALVVDNVRDAVAKEEGYLSRYDLGKADKLFVGMALSGVIPSGESSQVMRGWVADQLQEGEKLGGIGYREISYIPKNRSRDYANIMLNPKTLINPRQWRSQEELDSLSNLHQRKMIKVVGVMNEKGEPVSVISFFEGPRNTHGKKVRNASALPKELSPVPISI